MSIEFDNITFYSTKEVAARLGISAETVRQYIKTGKLLGKRIGNSFMVSEICLKQFLGLPIEGTVAYNLGAD